MKTTKPKVTTKKPTVKELKEVKKFLARHRNIIKTKGGYFILGCLAYKRLVKAQPIPFSTRFKECRENGMSVPSNKIQFGVKGWLWCKKHNTFCHSKVCAEERGVV